MARQLDLSGLDLRRSVKTFVLIVLLGAGAATAQVSPTDLVTAVRDGSGNLNLISWDVRGIRLNAQGAAAGAVSLISAVRADHPQAKRMITAVRDGSGNLKIIEWRMPVNGDTITRFEAGGGAAGEVSLIATACFLV